MIVFNHPTYILSLSWTSMTSVNIVRKPGLIIDDDDAIFFSLLTSFQGDWRGYAAFSCPHMTQTLTEKLRAQSGHVRTPMSKL